MQPQPKVHPKTGKPMKRKKSTNIIFPAAKSFKTDTTKGSPSPPVKARIASPTKPTHSPIRMKELSPTRMDLTKLETQVQQKTKIPENRNTAAILSQYTEKNGFGDTELVDMFKKVPMSNNQKGRIRQALKAQLQGSDNTISADLINGKIHAILKSTDNLTDSDLRRIRILHNMLQTASQPPTDPEKKKKKKVKKNKKKEGDSKTESKKEPTPKKKGPKRYVVFLGNLPQNVTKELILQHFISIIDNIKDVRMPIPAENKSPIAFMELSNKSTYEFALSKHHSMMNDKRINVTYTLLEHSKFTKSEAKSKAAKLIALQKSGKLAGSTAMVKKRTHRRNIMKRAKAKEAAAAKA